MDAGVLEVTIDIEHYMVTMPPDRELGGSFHDVLRGPLSEGGKIWQAQWISSGKMYGDDEDRTSTSEPKPLTFTKVSDEVYGTE